MLEVGQTLTSDAEWVQPYIINRSKLKMRTDCILLSSLPKGYGFEPI